LDAIPPKMTKSIEGIPIYFKDSGITIRTGTSGSRDSRKLISDIEIFTEDIIVSI